MIFSELVMWMLRIWRKFIAYIQGYNPALKYTAEWGKKVNMLDTTLEVGENQIRSTLYTKPTDSHAYLNYSSSHPRSCKNNIPYSQLLRVKKICSEQQDYEEKSKDMIGYFRFQGYPRHILQSAKSKADRVSRETLLTNDNIQVSNDEKRLVFPITYHPMNAKVTKIVKENCRKLATDEVGDFFEQPPMVAYRRDKNLKDILVHSKLRQRTEDTGTKECGRNRCRTCNHVHKEKLIVGPRNTFRINASFTCESKGVIYAIICKKCGELYVGETGRRMSDRFTEHLRDVRDKVMKEVPTHFNSDGHNGIEDMEICGLLLEKNLVSRKLKEQKLLDLVVTLDAE